MGKEPRPESEQATKGDGAVLRPLVEFQRFSEGYRKMKHGKDTNMQENRKITKRDRDYETHNK